MGPIVDAVRYTLEEASRGFETDWIHHIPDDVYRKAWIRQAGFAQHQKDAFIMRAKVAEGLLKKEGF